VGEFARLDAAAGVADRDPDQAVPAGDGQLDEVAVARMPDRVLQQRVHGEAEPFGVGQHCRGVEPP
jgi:hypothetical protein